MKYPEIVTAKFIERPNRFIAKVELAGEEVRVHVPNTGRCQELFVPDAKLVLAKAQTLGRKTPYSVIGVYKATAQGIRLINLDSQAPNRVVYEALASGKLLGYSPSYIKKEAVFGDSRLDFYFENGQTPEQPKGNCSNCLQKAFMEVKGVTLERDGAVFFPDAPTVRGVKHLNELIAAKAQGYQAFVVFVVQMKGATYFSPNTATHPQFAEALQAAAAAGVEVLAWDCTVTPASLVLNQPIEVRL